MAGKLYLVGTPIGNLGDITQRALKTLESVAHIAAEDTRRTRALLTHFGISGKKLHTLNAHARDADLEALLELVETGNDLALTTDAGMPSVSDPGTRLVARAAERGLDVVPIPGASALTAAVAVSGLVDGPFVFMGFLPTKGQKRKAALGRVTSACEPVVLFEAPHRAGRTLSELASLIPERRAVLCRELTKLHEELRRGTLLELSQTSAELRGEITVVIEGAPEQPAQAESSDELVSEIERRLAGGSSVKTVVTELAGKSGKPRREFYDLVVQLRNASRPRP
jgi:16S rRNA (cytidine1402-2'-O)-methyltransferase